MAKFILPIIGLIVSVYFIFKLINGGKLSIPEWIIFLISLLVFGSMLYYILTTN